MTYRLLTVAVTAVILGGCGGGGDDPLAAPSTIATTERTTTTTAPAPDPAFVQLCEVLGTAVAGDADEARATFDHGPLHPLADAALELDRGVAARLLEAKEAVESDVADPGIGADQLAADLRALVEAAAQAHALVDSGPPPTCEHLG